MVWVVAWLQLQKFPFLEITYCVIWRSEWKKKIVSNITTYIQTYFSFCQNRWSFSLHWMQSCSVMFEFTRFPHVFLVMFDCFACYSGFLFFFRSLLLSHTLPCGVTFSVLLKQEHNCHVFMCACKFALDKFTLCMQNKREKIKWISPKCVLFHILFGKFVELAAFIYGYVRRDVSWYRYPLHFSYGFDLGTP